MMKDLRDYGQELCGDTVDKEAPNVDYEMEFDRLQKENQKQDTIINALVFYINNGGEQDV